MASRPNPGFSTKQAYIVNIIALLPRQWFIYLVFGIVFPLMIFSNIDGGPNKDDSKHYFTLWFFGIFMISSLVGGIAAELMRKPLLYCMPVQQAVMRRVVVAIGLLVSVLAFVVAVLPKHSYWAPSTAIGLVSVFIIGLMLYLLIVSIAIRSSVFLLLLSVILALTMIIMPFIFRGSGPDITRPPMEIYGLLTIAALVVIPWAWKVLGSRTSLRKQFGTETASSPDENFAGLLHKMFLRTRANQGKDYSGTKSGARLLKKVSKVSYDGIRRPFLGFIYRMRSAISPGRILVIWFIFSFFSANLALRALDSFSPIILLSMLSLLATFQGALIFRTTTTPFIPLGRRAYFIECLLNAMLRYLLIIGVFLTILGLSFCIYKIWPNQAWSEHFLVVLQFPLKAYLLCLFMAPLWLFMFQFSRTPGWMVLALLFSWATVTLLAHLIEAFAGINYFVIVCLMAAAWLPFLILNYLRSFKQDLK